VTGSDALSQIKLKLSHNFVLISKKTYKATCICNHQSSELEQKRRYELLNYC